MSDVDADLDWQFQELGRLLATPAINARAELRRQESIRLTEGEIKRLQRNQAEESRAEARGSVNAGRSD